MALTAQQLSAREGKLTASAVGVLMGGDSDRILSLWRQLSGDPDHTSNNLDNVWAVQLGNTTENLNLDWYERKTGRPVTRRGEVVVHPKVEWAACTLDGWIDSLSQPIECKHVGGREPLVKVIARYQPQCHWQMIVTNANGVQLSVIEGANEPIIECIPFDKEYADLLWSRADTFMKCVRTMTPPAPLPSLSPPKIPSRSYHMVGNNQWSFEAGAWLESAPARERAKKAEASLKGMMPEDALRAHGYGVEIVRDRAGRLTLRPTTA